MILKSKEDEATFKNPVEIYTYIFYGELAFTFLLVSYMVYHYAAKTVPSYVKIVASLSWFMSFAVVCLLPYDISIVFP